MAPEMIRISQSGRWCAWMAAIIIRVSAVSARKQAVPRAVLVPHVPESLPLVIVAHFPVAIPGIQSQPALAPLPGEALRPAQDLRADAAPGLVARDRELVHIELVAAFFA